MPSGVRIEADGAHGQRHHVTGERSQRGEHSPVEPEDARFVSRGDAEIDRPRTGGSDADAVPLQEEPTVARIRGQQVEGSAEQLLSARERRPSPHLLVPDSIWTMPPESWSRRASGKPASRNIRTNSSGGGRYAVDRGRYEYASRFDSNPPIRGTIRRK